MSIKLNHAVINVLSIALIVFTTISNLAGQNSDSLRFAKESKHFEFYSTESDIKVLDSLGIILENNYSRITSHLGVQIDKKTKVKVFPSIQAFHDAINFPDAPDWVVGGTWNGHEILMVTPLHPGSIHTYESLMQVIVHEFTHIAIYYAREEKSDSGIPRWLGEGFAQYEAGQINDHIRKIVEKSVINNTPPTWAQLDSVSDMEFGNMNGYGFSVSIVDYLIATYGIDKLVLLIKEPGNFETIYGLPISTVENQWVRYLKRDN